MTDAAPVANARVGRPPRAVRLIVVNVRFEPPLLARIDAIATKAEASRLATIRRLLEQAVQSAEKEATPQE